MLLGYLARTSVEGPQVVGSRLGIGEATLPALQPENRWLIVAGSWYACAPTKHERVGRAALAAGAVQSAA